MGAKDLLGKDSEDDKESCYTSQSYHDEALPLLFYPSLEHFPSTEMDKFLSRHEEQLLNDQLQVRRGAQDRISLATRS